MPIRRETAVCILKHAHLGQEIECLQDFFLRNYFRFLKQGIKFVLGWLWSSYQFEISSVHFVQ